MLILSTRFVNRKGENVTPRPRGRPPAPATTPENSQGKPKSKSIHNPTKFNKFHQFSKFPPEIRLKIWRCMMRTRAIRAEYQNIESELVHPDMRLSRYVLDAGAVPAALHVCSESRQETKKNYTLIKSRLPVKPLEKDGERLPPGAEPRKMPKWLEAQIWVNVDIDIFFFVNFPSTNEFLTYFRRISKPSIGGLPLDTPIKHIALVGVDTQRFRTSGRTDLFYSLCMEHTRLETINIVMDNSKYRVDPKPESYSLWPLAPLGTHSRGGGTHGSREVREHVIDIFRGFWDGKKTVKEYQRWMAWRAVNKDWKPPKVFLKSIAKLQRSKTPRVIKKTVIEEVETEDEDEDEDEADESQGKAEA
ncbi:hypothetical protein IFR04_009340 [Cadophora malorum]|uniref:2EXR domain-containing protein n=1 Tax=Cadophora malorum TaxID=108018 RepID=A0A8H7TES9_9HELO|nr:hypothetical protein IFR04_009340 [Cadophora malorum]